MTVRLSAGDGGRLVTDLVVSLEALGTTPGGAEVKRWLRGHVVEYRPG